MGKKPTKIRSRILRAIIISVDVTSLVLLLTSSILVTIFLVKEAISQTDESAVAYGKYIQECTETIGKEFNLVSSDASIFDESVSIDKRMEKLNSYIKYTECEDLYIADSNGITWHNTDISQRDYFQNAMTGECYVSSPLLRLTDNSVSIMAGAKVKYEGFDGVIYGLVKGTYFDDIIKEAKVGKNGYAFLIDKDGTIIAHPDRTYVDNFINPIQMAEKDDNYKDFGEFVSKALVEENGSSNFKYDGERLIASYYHIDIPEKWTLVVVLPMTEINSRIVLVISILFGIVLILMLLCIWVANKVSNKISKPLVYYTERLKSFAEGDIYSPTEVKYTNDELEILGLSLSKAMECLIGCIRDVSNVLSNISDGNLMIETDANYIGDLDELKQSINQITASLRNTMTDINLSSNQVSSGAEQVAQGSQSLSQGAITQASTVQQLSATIGVIAEKTVANAEHSKNAKIETEKNSELIKDGSNQMSSLMNAMSDIDTSSAQIANIIKAIDDIAFQTNILALNAAVEAARAGTAGKGFAVVAEEVRNLAAKSAEAASNTAALIQSSIKAVKNGTNIAKQTSDTLDEIVENSTHIVSLIEDIANSTDEQAIQVNEIREGIDQISDVVQTNSATAEESAAASEELSSQANMLTGLVGKFKVE